MKKKKTQAKKKPAQKKSTAPANRSGVTPLGDRVLVKPLSAEDAGTTTSFGIIIPDTAKEKPEQGTVVAVGPGRRNEQGVRIPMEVKVGDRVFFKKPWDEPMKIDGTEYYVISESEITLIKQ